MAHIFFKDLNIGEITNSSGVFSGENLQVKWKAYEQTREGYGSLSGNSNRSINNQSIIIKPDPKKNNK